MYMKYTLFITAAFAIFSFASCNNAGTGNETPKTDSTAMKAQTKADKNKKTIMEGMVAFNAHDAEKVLKDASPDFIEYQDGSMPPVKGVDSVKKMLSQYMNAFLDLKSENTMYFADG